MGKTKTSTGSKEERVNQLIEALLTFNNVKEAANSVGVPYSTARTWLYESETQELLRKARMQVYGVALGRLQGLAAEACKVLAAALKRGDVSVAKYIMSMGAEFADADIDRRLSALEASRRGT